MTEGNLVLAAPAGIAGSFLRPGERAPGAGEGGSGREAWQEEEEDGRSGCCWSADALRRMPSGCRWCRGSDRVVRRVCGLGERRRTGLDVRAASSSGSGDGGEVGN